MPPRSDRAWASAPHLRPVERRRLIDAGEQRGLLLLLSLQAQARLQPCPQAIWGRRRVERLVPRKPARHVGAASSQELCADDVPGAPRRDTPQCSSSCLLSGPEAVLVVTAVGIFKTRTPVGRELSSKVNAPKLSDGRCAARVLIFGLPSSSSPALVHTTALLACSVDESEHLACSGEAGSYASPPPSTAEYPRKCGTSGDSHDI